MLPMSLTESERLRERLRNLDEEFDDELRKRGFDPAQADNVALPTHLAELKAARDEVSAQLAEFEGREKIG